jgi:hypothetical protein
MTGRDKPELFGASIVGQVRPEKLPSPIPQLTLAAGSLISKRMSPAINMPHTIVHCHTTGIHTILSLHFYAECFTSRFLKLTLKK